jgi:uncharacterized membrane protein
MDEILNYLHERTAVIPFLTGIIFSITAVVTLLFPPKKINDLYGYRTASSMKSEKAWEFSQRYSSIRMFRGGIFLLLVSVAISPLKIHEPYLTIIGVTLLISVCLYMLWSTEKAIKKNFTKEK